MIKKFMSRKYIILPCLAVALIVGATFFSYFHGGTFPVLAPAGPVAAEESWIILVTTLLCAIIVVPVFVLLFYFGWKYRYDNPRAETHHAPDWDHDNALIEFSWWLAPAVIIAILGGIMWQSSHQLDPYKPLESTRAPLTVQVVALEWKWLFIYPEQHIATVNMLKIPQGVPVHLELTADAPMNTIWIPALAGQIMLMPGMKTQLNLMASKTGDFNGLSGNISGEGFAGMTFLVKSLPRGDFAAWVSGVQSSSSTPLDAMTYAKLASPSADSPVMEFHPVDTSLFLSTIMKYMVPTHSMTSVATTSAMSMPMQTPMSP